jgi:hypothetical protein
VPKAPIKSKITFSLCSMNNLGYGTAPMIDFSAENEYFVAKVNLD